MRIKREIAQKINFILNELVPPILRDSKFFAYIPMRIIAGKDAHIYFDFKEKAYNLSDEEFSNIYRITNKYSIQGETDLNQKSIEEILKNTFGSSILEVGCGRGYLANRLSELGKITACDIDISVDLKEKYPHIHFIECGIENLPFKDKEFDTVICTHVLEHVRDIHGAIKELRRVCKKNLIIVVPKERPYKFTFNLHLHFFPYQYCFVQLMGIQKNQVCKEIGRDIFYMENCN